MKIKEESKRPLPAEDEQSQQEPLKRTKIENSVSALNSKWDKRSITEDDIDQFLSQRHEGIKLNAEQREILLVAFTGDRRNVFYTGPGGVGKTTVTKVIKEFLTEIFGDSSGKFGVSASTGIAATHLSGCTLHSLMGCGVPVYIEDFDRMWDQRDTIRKLEVLIIDEISMISGEFLDHLSSFVSNIRRETCKSAFGGIQLLLCGDFFQLPPISKSLKEGETYDSNLIFNR
jgi:ATP-dependent DNA helicase PIF1